MQCIEVCSGEICLKKGSQKIYNLLSSSKDREVKHCSCLGHCADGPNILVDEQQFFDHVNTDTIEGHIRKEDGSPFKRLTLDEVFDSENFLGDL